MTYPLVASVFPRATLTTLVIASTVLGACVVTPPAATPATAPSPRTIATVADGDYALRTSNGHYLVAEDGGGADANANRPQIGGWERFTVVNQGGSKVALRTINGHY